MSHSNLARPPLNGRGSSWVEVLMNAGTVAPDCAESMSHRRLYLPAEVTQRHLSSGAPSMEERTRLYGALLSSLVWVTECELGLGDAGPFVELFPLSTVAGRVLAVYTSCDRAPSHAVVVEAVAFVDLLEVVGADVSVLVDPVHAAVVIPPGDLALLRGVMSEL